MCPIDSSLVFNSVLFFSKFLFLFISSSYFILVEKIRSSDPQFEDILNQLYFDFKLRQNLTESEILKKAKSLRSSMFLFNEKKTSQLIKKVGFNSYEVFFKCFNFIGYIIIK